MKLNNKTSTITVALVAALVVLAIVSHASRSLTFAQAHPAACTSVPGATTGAGCEKGP
jgi:hypothetical protein